MNIIKLYSFFEDSPIFPQDFSIFNAMGGEECKIYPSILTNIRKYCISGTVLPRTAGAGESARLAVNQKPRRALRGCSFPSARRVRKGWTPAKRPQGRGASPSADFCYHAVGPGWNPGRRSKILSKTH
jgi:hypothetical protein